ncbi:hypothetical protein HGRIS_010061 [Hohenbuehelia grisea]|uniref:Uncharacterized protein n=1 Tax=Hohenbuehelia grisea TaxID=104357 RepID=A0ABR3J354_9AGAR
MSVPLLSQIFAFLWLAQAVMGEDLVTPGELLVFAKTDVGGVELKPLIFKPLASSTGDTDLATRDNPLAGLLQPRQSCPSGYGSCRNNPGRCCPLSGRCCTNGCCRAGFWCYSSGCCSLSEIGCEQVSCCPVGSNCCKGGGCCSAGDYCTVVNGRRGCCEIGKICTSSSGQCTSSGYTHCAGEDFCCPSGDTCSRDSSGQPVCRRSSGSNPPPPPLITTATRTTSLTDTRTSTSSSFSIVSPIPTPDLNSLNIEVTTSDTRISYSGAWLEEISRCADTISSRRSSSIGTSFTFRFEGTRLTCLQVGHIVTWSLFRNCRLDEHHIEQRTVFCHYRSRDRCLRSDHRGWS